MSDAPPPPVPAPHVPPPVAEPPKRRGLPVWAIVLIAVGGFGLVVVVGLFATVATVVPQMQEKQKRFGCMNNLSQLCGILVAQRVERSAPLVPGPALFLGWRKSGRSIRPGQETVLVCPGDPGAMGPAQLAAVPWQTLDVDHPPAGLCSYAVRDFANHPLPKDGGAQEAIAACVHHRRGAVVAYDDGSVYFRELEELGVSDPADLTFGPASKVEAFRTLIAPAGAR